MIDHKSIVKPKIIKSKKDGTHAVIHFSNMGEMLSCVDQGEYHHKVSKDEEWTYGRHVVGRDALERALKMGKTSEHLVKQYQKQRAMLEMKAGIRQFTGMGLSCRRKRAIRDDGDDLSMSRLMGGGDQYWVTTIRESKRANVRIGMNMAISWQHKEKDFVRLGATLAVMSDVLTKLGYAVEVIAFNFVGYNGKKKWKHLGMSIPMKMPNEPLDIHRLLTSGLPGLFRDKCFGLMGKAWDSNSTMGYQTPVTDTYKKELNLLHVVEQEFCKTDEKAVDGLHEMIKGLSDKPVWMR